MYSFWDQMLPKGYGMPHSDAVAVAVHHQNFSCKCSYANTQSNANRVIQCENLQHFILIIFIHFLRSYGVAA
ncbi:hypothetical protein Y032_0552g3328 [Ancylostoma ceylanicum]|uniref:Uncharacterized protein n=1 Tax=Ancylostoma ceylanicum TaxID=53326 RepID=A0A016WRE0_9BILA|nr:hypothetical protein Y032_0552g3328 [Ancylostoma ceylanicum]